MCIFECVTTNVLTPSLINCYPEDDQSHIEHLVNWSFQILNCTQRMYTSLVPRFLSFFVVACEMQGSLGEKVTCNFLASIFMSSAAPMASMQCWRVALSSFFLLPLSFFFACFLFLCCFLILAFFFLLLSFLFGRVDLFLRLSRFCVQSRWSWEIWKWG